MKPQADRWGPRDPRWLETPPYQFPPRQCDPIRPMPVNWWNVALYLTATTGLLILAIKAIAILFFGAAP